MASRSGFAVVVGLVILLFFSEVFREMAENGRGITRSAFEGGNTARPSPTVATLHANDDVFIKEAAVFEETDRGLRREFIGSELANADQIAESFRIFRLCQIEKRIQAVHFAPRGWLPVLRKGL